MFSVASELEEPVVLIEGLTLRSFDEYDLIKLEHGFLASGIRALS